MATAYARRSFNGGAVATTVANGIGIGDGSCTIASASGWPSGSGGHFFVDVDKGLPTEEKIECSGLAGTLLTFAGSGRNADGSTAFAHGPNCSISVCHVAQDDDEANQAVSGLLGQSGAAKGDILAMNSVGPPNVLTRVPIGTAGQLLGVSSGLPAWQYPALVTASDTASANTTLPSNTATPMVIGAASATATATLAVGTWLVTMSALLEFDSTTSAIITADAGVASGTATLSGPNSTQISQSSATGAALSVSLTFIATVTVAATLKLTGKNTGSNNAFSLHSSQTGTLPTGYVATRIA